MKIIAEMSNHSIEDPFVIGKILSHLEAMYGSQGPEKRRLWGGGASATSSDMLAT